MKQDGLHGNDNRAGLYDIVVLTAEGPSGEDDCIFNDSYLLRRRCTLSEACWLATSDYFCPVTEPGSATTTSNMSLERRVAQTLGGESVPHALFEALLHNGNNPPQPLLSGPMDSVCVFHQTPLDGCVETVCLKTSLQMKGSMRCYSASKQAEGCISALNVMQRKVLLDWKNSSFQVMPAPSRKFVPELPVDQCLRFSGPDHPTLEVLKLENGQAVIPDEVKKRWHNHVVYGAEWLQELRKLEDLLKQSPEETPAPALAVPDVQVAPAESVSADETHEMATNITNLKLVWAKTGDKVELFAKATSGPAEVPADAEIVGHGGGDWIRPPQSTRLLTSDTEPFLHTFLLATDDEEDRIHARLCILCPGLLLPLYFVLLLQLPCRWCARCRAAEACRIPQPPQ